MTDVDDTDSDGTSPDTIFRELCMLRSTTCCKDTSSQYDPVNVNSKSSSESALFYNSKNNSNGEKLWSSYWSGILNYQNRSTEPFFFSEELGGNEFSRAINAKENGYNCLSYDSYPPYIRSPFNTPIFDNYWSRNLLSETCSRITPLVYTATSTFSSRATNTPQFDFINFQWKKTPSIDRSPREKKSQSSSESNSEDTSSFEYLVRDRCSSSDCACDKQFQSKIFSNKPRKLKKRKHKLNYTLEGTDYQRGNTKQAHSKFNLSFGDKAADLSKDTVESLSEQESDMNRIASSKGDHILENQSKITCEIGTQSDHSEHFMKTAQSKFKLYGKSTTFVCNDKVEYLNQLESDSNEITSSKDAILENQRSMTCDIGIQSVQPEHFMTMKKMGQQETVDSKTSTTQLEINMKDIKKKIKMKQLSDREDKIKSRKRSGSFNAMKNCHFECGDYLNWGETQGEILEHLREINRLIERESCASISTHRLCQSERSIGYLGIDNSEQYIGRKLNKAEKEKHEFSKDSKKGGRVYWAVTKVTVYPDSSRTYEVMRLSKRRPQTVPSTSDTVFVLLPKQ